ncbi:hypothetical protein [Catenuloplanes indicus]|uniref:Membrane protein implicated in regulation of membrane protease activity n=1 Tax=Catenuloplanes indicus TaxID=137267 RepID=A0AAE3W1B6_9ACTN|nr:hypothetical protein [Catenuloplanes indicus]MDQ0367701.1 membrane protein implicated in regulation of membrane protease activity [Catenuloplanes indicus]
METSYILGAVLIVVLAALFAWRRRVQQKGERTDVVLNRRRGLSAGTTAVILGSTMTGNSGDSGGSGGDGGGGGS